MQKQQTKYPHRGKGVGLTNFGIEHSLSDQRQKEPHRALYSVDKIVFCGDKG